MAKTLVEDDTISKNGLIKFIRDHEIHISTTSNMIAFIGQYAWLIVTFCEDYLFTCVTHSCVAVWVYFLDGLVCRFTHG